VSRQIRSLVDRGLVERTPDPDDRRGALLAVSPSGLAVYQAFRDQRNEELAGILKDWPGEDRHDLVRLFTLLNDGFAERYAQQQHASQHHAQTTNTAHAVQQGAAR
jgi:DNA-binding MarR family transcriptional regulator